ncbi:MAG TPA: VTT domain-containing protein [Candidatus Eisenbacteria bacterium]|nr:VTT domain-containing protein [Candidatus Eisenbacteria bacterium]
MAEIITWIMDSIRAHGAWSVFVGVIIESVIVPIPSPVIIMGAGFILIGGELSFVETLTPMFLQIVLPGSVASTVGAYIAYGIGYFGGKALVDRWERFLGFRWSDIEAMERRFRAGQIKTSLFFLRAVPIFPLSVISAGAGLIRLPLNQFSLWTFYGTIPRCLLLGYLGWGLGETYRGVALGIDRIETIVSVVLIALVLGVIFWLRARVRRNILD